MEDTNNIKRINNVMTWLPALLVAFVTALTYPVTYFWFKGISDFYNMDLAYAYGNYNSLVGNVLITIVSVIALLIGAYLICKWIMKENVIWAKIGRGFLAFFCSSNNKSNNN